MKISVLIPTWKRKEKLKNALKAVASQRVYPDQLVIVCRDIDTESQDVVKEFMSENQNKFLIELGIVDKPGVIFAENKALDLASGDIICFADDDAVIPLHWVETVRNHFLQAPKLAGVGGPDFILNHGDKNYRKTVLEVGKIKWYGKVVGNHHHMVSKVMRVDVLKGVNMSFRRSYVKHLDTNLQSEHHAGNGSHWELDLCFHVAKLGGEMIFDPALDVIHDSNHSHFVHRENFINNARNLSYVMFKNLPLLNKIIFLFYILFVGNEQIYGGIKVLTMLPRLGFKDTFKNYSYSLMGLKLGIATYFKASS